MRTEPYIGNIVVIPLNLLVGHNPRTLTDEISSKINRYLIHRNEIEGLVRIIYYALAA